MYFDKKLTKYIIDYLHYRGASLTLKEYVESEGIALDEKIRASMNIFEKIRECRNSEKSDGIQRFYDYMEQHHPELFQELKGQLLVKLFLEKLSNNDIEGAFCVADISMKSKISIPSEIYSRIAYSEAKGLSSEDKERFFDIMWDFIYYVHSGREKPLMLEMYENFIFVVNNK